MAYPEYQDLPKFLCHKIVGGLKIGAIQHLEEGPTTREIVILVPEDESYAPFEVPVEWCRKTGIKPGWYFVIYHGGYCSASPAEAFEEGYSPDDGLPLNWREDDLRKALCGMAGIEDTDEQIDELMAGAQMMKVYVDADTFARSMEVCNSLKRTRRK